MNDETNTARAIISIMSDGLIFLSSLLWKKPDINPDTVYARADRPMNEPASISSKIPAAKPVMHPVILPFLIPIYATIIATRSGAILYEDKLISQINLF